MRTSPISQSTHTILALLLLSAAVSGQEQPKFEVPDDVAFRTADIISEGTRMAALVFAPKPPENTKLPTIVMSHGWGGTAAALRPDAIRFAQAGYLVVAFDYRGWGQSDARLVAVGKPAAERWQTDRRSKGNP